MLPFIEGDPPSAIHITWVQGHTKYILRILILLVDLLVLTFLVGRRSFYFFLNLNITKALIYIYNARFGNSVTSVTITSHSGVKYGPYGTLEVAETQSKSIYLDCALGLEGYTLRNGWVKLAVVTSHIPSQHSGKLGYLVTNNWYCHCKIDR